LALDFRKYLTLELVYVSWIRQVYPHDIRPLLISEEDIAAGRHGDATRAVLAIPTEAIEEFEEVESAWDEELKRRGLNDYLAKRKVEAKLPKRAKIRQPLSEASRFVFVRDAKIRTFVERDIADLQEARLWGSLRLRFVLAGGLIEGLLLDALMSHPHVRQTTVAKREKGDLEYWALGSLLEAAAELGLLSVTAVKLGTPVREMRNFVHPGVEWRSNLLIEKEEVEIAEKVLDIVIRDLSRRKPGAP
jgi:hypothetical protein